MSAPSDLRAADRPSVLAGKSISVLFCCDPGYYQHLAVAMVSLLENNRRHSLDIHLITSGIDPAAEAQLAASLAPYANLSFRIHDFSAKRTQGWHTSYHITGEAYIRLFAPAILDAQIERVIYLDCDLVVVGDLQDLWDTDLKDCALAAVPDPFGAYRKAALGMPGGAAYINSGVLLLDLAKWRSQGLSSRVIAYVEQAGGELMFHDQDAINAVLHATTRPLDYRWNFQAKMLRPSQSAGLADRKAIDVARPAPAIIHYTSVRKPWLFVMATPGKHLYRRYLQKTAWRNTPSIGRSWRGAPEYCVNHLLYLLRIDYTWDRVLRATTIGRIIDRLLRLAERATARRRIESASN
jgi:lipopolysaccharide biosynthesis glycosyltransferase